MAASRTKDLPQVRLRSPEGTARILRAHFARHNFRVLLLAAGTLLAALACWGGLYLVSCWLLVLGFATFDVTLTHIPTGFDTLFAVAALCAIAYAWIEERIFPNAHPRDHKNLVEIAAEFILAIPHMTLAIGGTLRAWLRLSDMELVQAASLLHWIAEEKRVPMSGVRLEIPDPATVARVLFALQLTQIIEVRRDDTEYWLKLNTLRPAELRLVREDLAGA